LDFGAAWLSANERVRARTMLAKLAEWLRDSRSALELAGVEEAFDVVVGDAQLVGRVDRIERDHDGRLVVIDLKTGKSKPTADELPEHPQLGAYQLAVQAGGFADRFGPAEPGGARLVHVGGTTKGVGVQAQQPLAQLPDPNWIGAHIGYLAERLRGGEFNAAVNTYCSRCDVRSSCPLTEGRQVTE
jgi:RecB family exonuclease